MKYKPVYNVPIAKFFYKGNHSHPVKRTVLVIDSDLISITGYELRESIEIRKLSKAPIKTYRRDRIAKGKNLRLNNPLRKKAKNKSTLIRKGIMYLLETGI